jgi:hypothetical protein
MINWEEVKQNLIKFHLEEDRILEEEFEFLKNQTIERCFFIDPILANVIHIDLDWISIETEFYSFLEISLNNGVDITNDDLRFNKFIQIINNELE